MKYWQVNQSSRTNDGLYAVELDGDVTEAVAEIVANCSVNGLPVGKVTLNANDYDWGVAWVLNVNLAEDVNLTTPLNGFGNALPEDMRGYDTFKDAVVAYLHEVAGAFEQVEPFIP